ncbi:hypothetical protein OSB04_014839 [Centaurea solstitialis]|uniref:Protein kinase domain-containing protein n=1 Tax=Centaurea solstitialis TaxID=347529 RepID=A0AA38SZF1_9ASTR|nr:hypothetical protein OSB04_014839 [Centaurea solstitialis]
MMMRHVIACVMYAPSGDMFSLRGYGVSSCFGFSRREDSARGTHFPKGKGKELRLRVPHVQSPREEKERGPNKRIVSQLPMLERRMAQGKEHCLDEDAFFADYAESHMKPFARTMGNLNQKPQEQLFTCEMCTEPLKLSVNNKFNKSLHPFCNECTMRYNIMKLDDIKYPNQPVDPETLELLDKWNDELYELVVLKDVESPFIVKGNNGNRRRNKISHRVVVSDGNRLMRICRKMLPVHIKNTDSSFELLEQTCRRYTLAEIQSATHNFDKALVIGRGGFGKVYRSSSLIGSTNEVAIKRLDSVSNQGAVEYEAEIKVLSKLRHCNLVSLIGYCDEGQEMLLVYEFMPNGTLGDHLHKDDTNLSWLERLEICLGAARGLDYLHTGIATQHGVTHRDVKSSNILLDANFSAKIADFGLAKVGPTNQTQSYVSTCVKGTFGYMDPCYFYSGRLTRKSDVYAFGVVLFEVLSGRQAVDPTLDEEQWSLAAWVQEQMKDGKLNQVIDSRLTGQISRKCLKEFASIAAQCLHNQPKQRPTMAEVVVKLESILSQERKSIDSAVNQGGLFNTVRSFFAGKAVGSKSEISTHDILKSNNRALRTFTYDQLVSATNNFQDKEHSLTVNDTIYKGWVEERTFAPTACGVGLAIYVRNTGTSKLDLKPEKYNHPNLVKLLGYCLNGEELFCVYELPDTTLDERLFRDQGRNSLTWGARLKIAVGAAEGLSFLHQRKHQACIQLNTTLILLDKDLNVRLPDFEKSSLGYGPYPFGTDAYYAAPEWFRYQAGKLDSNDFFGLYHFEDDAGMKSEIHTFGVILLEILTGMKVFDVNRLQGKQNLVTWATPLLAEEVNLAMIMDPQLRYDDYPPKGALKLGLLVSKCLQPAPDKRPSMEEILQVLYHCYQEGTARMQLLCYPNGAQHLHMIKDAKLNLQTPSNIPTISSLHLHLHLHKQQMKNSRYLQIRCSVYLYSVQTSFFNDDVKYITIFGRMAAKEKFLDYKIHSFKEFEFADLELMNGRAMESEPSSSSTSSLPESHPCRHFEFHEIQLATNNFDESFVIGRGGFGKVYKGNIINGSSVVVAAIKRLDSMSKQGATEFWAEVEMLSKLRHCNLVSLFGHCNYGKEMMLVYEYMPNGTLEDHLHKLGTPLSWLQRLKICIGAARGLHYLHTGTGIQVGIIHRDVKTSNILLHESWTAKISDFGLSKIGPTDQPSTCVSTLVKGTFGYFDPDYYATGKLTRKSDVYAFGVVLLEVLCRKRAVDPTLGEEQWNLARWAQESIRDGKLKHIVDYDIKDQICTKCLKEFVRIVERCLHNNPKQRTTMAEVVANLESVLTLQEKFNNSLQGNRTIVGWMVDMLPFPTNRENSEVSLLGQLSHPNIISLLGYCSYEHEYLLVYEYMQNRSFDRLFTNATPLSWGTRLKIMTGVARGLAYLHSSKPQVILRGFKSADILLDQDFNAKLGDFGLAKHGPDIGETHVSTGVMGTYGYAAPEYIATGHLTAKSDIYGFGVVLLETLTGLRVLDTNRPASQQNLVEWKRPILARRNKLKKIMDPRLQQNYSLKAAFKCTELASKCLAREPRLRPSSEEVLQSLEQIYAIDK